jgi:hypothetical protein
VNQLERAGTALRQRPAPTTSVEIIERRAGELTRRRRVGWTAVVTALVVVIAALIGVGTLRARSNDESIVVGPSPDPNGSLTMALHGVPDQATADEVVRIMRDRIERLNLDGFSISNGRRAPQYDQRVAIDMAEVQVEATPSEVVVTAPAAVRSRLGLAPALWGSGHSAFVVVRSDAGVPEDGRCPVGTLPTIGLNAPHCYAIDSTTIDPAIDAAIERTATASLSGNLLIGWDVAGFDGERLRALGDTCSQPLAGDSCPTHEVAIRTTDDRLGVFTFSPATPPGMPFLVPLTPMSFDESLAWSAMLTKPLPSGVTLDPPALPFSVVVLVAQSPIRAGSVLYPGANLVLSQVSTAMVPMAAVHDPRLVSGRTAAVDIPSQAIITEEMLE